MVGFPNCHVPVCCGDCRAFGLGSRGRYGNNKLGGKLTEAPAVEVVLVVVLLVGRLYTSLFDPPGLQKTATQYSGSPVKLPANKTRLTGQGQTGHEASYAYVWRRLV